MASRIHLSETKIDFSLGALAGEHHKSITSLLEKDKHIITEINDAELPKDYPSPYQLEVHPPMSPEIQAKIGAYCTKNDVDVLYESISQPHQLEYPEALAA